MSTTFERVAKIITEETPPANAVESVFASLATGGDVPDPATATPEDLGTAAVGTSLKYAREDHVHDMPSASDVGAIPAPESPAAGQSLVYDGTAWSPATVPSDEQVATAVDAWLDENISQETGYALDRTLTLENAAAPADLVGDLKSAINGVYAGKEYVFYTLANGYIATNGNISSPSAPANEVYTNKIPVSQGDVIEINLKLKSSGNQMWFVYATYNSSETFIARTTIASAVQQTYTGEITIPSGVGYVAFSFRTFDGASFSAVKKKLPLNGANLDKDSVEFPALSNGMKSATRNLFDEAWECTYYNSSGVYTPATNTHTACPPNVPVTGGSAYSFSWGSHEYSGSCTFYVLQFNSSKSKIKHDSWNYTKQSVTITLESNTEYIGLMVWSDGTAVSDWTKLVPQWTQVEAGSVATEYIEPKVLNNKYIDADTLAYKMRGAIKEEAFAVMPSSTINTIAHRGDDVDAPQNTAPAYIIARKHGLSIAENDLRLSYDGEFVMWHDNTLSLFGNLVDINGYLMYTDGTDFYWVDPSDNSVYTWSGTDYISSAVSLGSLTRCAGANYSTESLSLAVLKRIDFGIYKGPQFAGTQILTLEEWVMLCKQLGMEIYIDRKLTYTSDLVIAAANIVKKCGMASHASWLELGPAYITALRTVIPDARVGVLAHPTNERISNYTQFNTGRGFFFNGDAKEGMTAEVIQLGLNAGFDVEVWFVDTTTYTEEQILQTIRTAVSYGVTGITLDHYRAEDAFEYLLEQY